MDLDRSEDVQEKYIRHISISELIVMQLLITSRTFYIHVPILYSELTISFDNLTPGTRYAFSKQISFVKGRIFC